MKLNSRIKVLLIVLALLSAFAVGRYTAQKSAVKTVVDNTTKTDIKSDKETHRETTTTTEKQPDGTTKTITKIVEDSNTKKETNSKSETHVDQTVTTPKTNTLNVSALVGADIKTLTPVYGASVSKQFLGPVTIGAFGLTNGTVGASIGVNF